MSDEWEPVARLGDLLKAGDTATIIAQAPRAISRATDQEAQAYLLGLLAAAYQRTKDWNRSFDCATKALKLDPSIRHIHITRVAALLGAGAYPKAVADADRLIHKEPEYALAYYVRSAGHLMVAVGSAVKFKALHLRRALADVDHALVLDPDDTTYTEHREALTSLLGPDYVRAEESIDGWKLAGNLAEVAGKLLRGFVGV